MTVPIAGRGPQVNAVVGLFLALSTVAISLRCYCRAIVVKSFGIDDWFAVVAWVCFSAPRVPVNLLLIDEGRYSSFSSAASPLPVSSTAQGSTPMPFPQQRFLLV
jgi:hypothetical protein